MEGGREGGSEGGRLEVVLTYGDEGCYDRCPNIAEARFVYAQVEDTQACH